MLALYEGVDRVKGDREKGGGRMEKRGGRKEKGKKKGEEKGERKKGDRREGKGERRQGEGDGRKVPPVRPSYTLKVYEMSVLRLIDHPLLLGTLLSTLTNPIG